MLLYLNESSWLSDLLFIQELKTNFGTYNPIGKAEAELKGLHMQENHQAIKYFINFQQLAACVQWGKAALCRQAYNGLAKHIKDNMVHHNNQTPFLASGNLFKLSMHDTGNDVEKYPTKPALPDPPETRPNTSPTHPSQTTSPAKVLQSKQNVKHWGQVLLGFGTRPGIFGVCWGLDCGFSLCAVPTY